MDIKELYQYYLSHPVITTDSRQITNGCIFFALKGDNFNGNQFAEMALERGAFLAVIDDKSVEKAGSSFYLVDDVLKTLQELAKYHRKSLTMPVLAITGSNGKTTTKELCREVLNKKYKTAATLGNLNNHIGVPLTILRTHTDDTFLIVEMGANHQGEIQLLCEITDPDYVMINNIGKAHLEGFGGEEGVKKGKSEMYKYAARHHKKIFINQLDTVLKEVLPDNVELIPYNPTELLKNIHQSPNICFDYKDISFCTHLYGDYNIPNIAFAIALGEYFEIDSADIGNAIANYIPSNNRSQIESWKNNKIIKDAYNANPSSMKHALDAFDKEQGNLKIIILGDMLELGKYSRHEHRLVLEMVEKMNLADKIFIGKDFGLFKNEFDGNFFENVSEARNYFMAQNYQDHYILLKGSRGIAVEKILE